MNDLVAYLTKAPDLSIIPPEITLRDSFAAIALAGQLNKFNPSRITSEELAYNAYRIADAMMKEREATKERWKDERPALV